MPVGDAFQPLLALGRGWDSGFYLHFQRMKGTIVQSTLLFSYLFLASQLAFASPMLAQSSSDIVLEETAGDCGGGLALTGDPGTSSTLVANSELRVSDAAHRVRRNCIVNLSVDVPAGMKAHIATPHITFERAFADVARGNVSVHLNTDNNFASDNFVLLEPVGTNAAVDGPLDVTFPGDPEMTSGCGIKLRLTVAVDPTIRLLTEGAISNPPSTEATLLWRNVIFAPVTFTRCTPVVVP